MITRAREDAIEDTIDALQMGASEKEAPAMMQELLNAFRTLRAQLSTERERCARECEEIRDADKCTDEAYGDEAYEALSFAAYRIRKLT